MRPALAALSASLLFACGGPERFAGPLPYEEVGDQSPPDAHVGESFLDVVDRIPSFGGAWQEGGTYFVLMVEGATAAERDAAIAWGENMADGRGQVVLARADFTWRQLLDAKAAVRGVLGLEGVSYVDADERANRVTIAVVDEAARDRASAAVDRLELEAGLVRYVIGAGFNLP